MNHTSLLLSPIPPVHHLCFPPPPPHTQTLNPPHIHTLYTPQIRVETRPWQIELPSRKLEVELTTVSSNYHVEINPGDVGSNDRYVVQEIIKELAKNRPLDVSGKGAMG